MRSAGQQDSTEPQHALPLGLERADIPHLITSGLFGLVAVLALLLVVRPLALRLTASPPMVTGGGTAGTIVIDPQTGEPRSVGTAVESGSAGQSVQALSTQLAANGDDSLINMSKVEGQVRASSLRRTAALAEKHPEETLSILRAWMAQSEAT
jgi:flagellar M-ring protein FliF